MTKLSTAAGDEQKNKHMKKQYVYLALLIVTTTAVSCQKEVSVDLPGNSNFPAAVNGTWKFINLNAITESIVQEKDGIDVVRTVTTSNYVSQDNTGILQMDGTTMTVSNLSYKINSTAKSYIYFNNQLEDSLEFPLTFSVPPTNTKSKYKLIGADSIYMEGGAVFNTSGGTVTTQGQRAHLRFEGNKMIMTSKGEQFKTETTGGIIRTQQSKATSIVTYQKQ